MLKMPYRLSAFWHTTSVNQNMSSVRLFVFHPQTECLFHLNPCMVAVTFTVLQQNWLDFFFFLLYISWVEDSFLPQILEPMHRNFFFFVELRTFSFLLKGGPYCFPLAYANYQHHHSCALEPLIPKRQMIGTQTLC